ncbi:MAG: hypothetical protein WC717_05715, partial [Candidatus Micrarchaeia archaeon]
MFLYQATNTTKASPYGISAQDKIVILQERLDAIKKSYEGGKDFYPIIQDDISRMANAVNSRGGYNTIYADLLEKRIVVYLGYLEEYQADLKKGRDGSAVDAKYKDRLYSYDAEIAKIEKKISGPGTGFVEGEKQGQKGNGQKGPAASKEDYLKELDALIRMAETYNMLHPNAKIKVPSVPADATEERLLLEINKLRAALGLGAKEQEGEDKAKGGEKSGVTD